jgi:metal-responsive CopG/Arc/MetJ family transcriptional regulator
MAPVTEKPPTKTVRLNVSLSEKNYDELKKLAAQLGMDMSEFVRNAIRTYNSIRRETLDGKQVYIGQYDKLEKEIIIP